MKVKIGDIWYDSDTAPICLELTTEERQHLEGCPPDHNRIIVGSVPDAADEAKAAQRLLAWSLDEISLTSQPTDLEVDNVVKGMLAYGGDFCGPLGRALQAADSNNRRRVRDGFPDYWARYKQMGEQLRAREVAEEAALARETT